MLIIRHNAFRRGGKGLTGNDGLDILAGNKGFACTYEWLSAIFGCLVYGIGLCRMRGRGVFFLLHYLMHCWLGSHLRSRKGKYDAGNVAVHRKRGRRAAVHTKI